ncbi:MAG: putative lipid II flippase FtsW [Oscillospiraceae bacterium]|nr:putative lipid II flippase FtsW [Oscillospiraceae bacterium]
MDPNTRTELYDAPLEGAELEAALREARRTRPHRTRRKGLVGRYGIRGFDVPYFMLTVMLMSIGLVMLFSASYSAAYYKYGNATYFFSRQVWFALGGFAIMFLVTVFPYQIYHRFAVPGLLVAFVLLIAVLFIGENYNNATRWISIGKLFTIQPSEIAKAAVILSFSSFAVRMGKRMRSFLSGIVPFLLIIGMMAVLLMREPHLSATVIIAVTGIVIIFIAGARVSHLAIIGVIGIALFAWLVFGLGYSIDRIHIWLDPYLDPRGDGYQILQSLYAIGSGGVFGLGLGQSRQKNLYLPEPYNDFIFAIICEELGYVGAILIILLFAAFILRGYYIALKARDEFGMLIAVGVTTQIAVQVFFNIGVVTGMLPVTGISLPFFSSGGTSLLILFAELGMVLAVSRQIPAKRKG